MDDKQKGVIEKLRKVNIVVVIFIVLILIPVVMAIFEFVEEHISTDFECSVNEYYLGNYSEALTKINNSTENTIEKNYIRGLINYKLNKYQESLKDLNIVSENMKSIDSIANLFSVHYQNIFKEDKYYEESAIGAFILTHKIKSECKFYLKDYRGSIINSNTAIDTLVKYQKQFDGEWVKNTYTSLHYYNAVSKYKLKNYEDALFSLNEVIEFKGVNNFPKAYLYKGLIEIKNRNKDSACINFSKAGELGCKEAYTFIKKYCN
jgi:hypothetical protein